MGSYGKTRKKGDFEMRYADNCCTYVEEFEPEHVYIYTGKCVVSGEVISVRVPAAGLYAYRQDALIQDAFPAMPVEEREFLMSGISAKAFAAMEATEEFEKELQ
jgi:hypothetical protein